MRGPWPPDVTPAPPPRWRHTHPRAALRPTRKRTFQASPSEPTVAHPPEVRSSLQARLPLACELPIETTSTLLPPNDARHLVGPSGRCRCADRLGPGYDSSLGGLHEHPPLTREAELEALPGPHADQRLGLHIGPEGRRDAARPGDRGLRIGERWRLGDIEPQRLAIGHERHQPAP